MHAQESNAPGRRRWWWVAGTAVVALVVGGVIGGVIESATSSSSASPTPTPTSARPRRSPTTSLPAVVTIQARNGTTGGTGSGEIIRSDGYILTNNHVISVAANGGTVEVIFSDGTSAPPPSPAAIPRPTWR